jgi:arylsulfatase A-like enzyme
VAELYKLPMMNLRTQGPNAKDWRHLGDWRVIVDGKDKYGWSSNGTPFLIDLARDPEERTNVVEQKPALAQRLDQALKAYIKVLPKPGATGEVEQPTPAELEVLKSLGYVGE